MGVSSNRGNQESSTRRNECPAPLQYISEPMGRVKMAPWELAASKTLWELICKESVALKYKAMGTKADHTSSISNWLISPLFARFLGSET